MDVVLLAAPAATKSTVNSKKRKYEDLESKSGEKKWPVKYFIKPKKVDQMKVVSGIDILTQARNQKVPRVETE